MSLLLSYCLNNTQSPHSSFQSSVWSNMLQSPAFIVPISLTFVGEGVWLAVVPACPTMKYTLFEHILVQHSAKTLFIIFWGTKDRCLVNMCSYSPAVSLPCNGSLALFIFLVFGVAELTVGECITVRLFNFYFILQGSTRYCVNTRAIVTV